MSAPLLEPHESHPVSDNGQTPAPRAKAPLLEVRNLTKFFPVRAGVFLRKVGDVHAVDDVSFTLAPVEGERPGRDARARR